MIISTYFSSEKRLNHDENYVPKKVQILKVDLLTITKLNV